MPFSLKEIDVAIFSVFQKLGLRGILPIENISDGEEEHFTNEDIYDLGRESIMRKVSNGR